MLRVRYSLKMTSIVENGIPVCWICGAEAWRPFKPSTIQDCISPEDFRITDARYGHTGRIDACAACGFKQCVDAGAVLPYYEDLDDPAYDEGRAQRGLQAAKILQAVARHKRGGRLLDVGAASGILVEKAGELGYDAVGVEPSRHLAERARQAGLNVHLGAFPHPAISGSFDVITLVDVIEHVPSPVQLLRDIAGQLAPGGLGVVTTPNVESLAARVLGRRWWHFRIAHIGYFSRRTLLRALEQAGLEAVDVSSPPWFFGLDYAGERVLQYLPRALRFGMPAFARRFTVRVNFYDSLQVIFRKRA